MSQASITVKNVFKRFCRRDGTDSLRDLVAGFFRNGGRIRRAAGSDFWALDDVSFEVEPGEALGIIGPNGAGKSTMLKLLAGIMRPTSGRLEIRGRVSALIELGAGFHGDLTGRENIFLNASILGMSRAEVRKNFNEIVEFADIGDFLDMPIKRYSSGMHARLGFAIAAHARPRILLVDEVLSVGDRVFRAKCMEKMSRFQEDGVAVVFVSHDLSTVSRFCNRALLLERGTVSYCGSANEAIGSYYQACVAPILIRRPDGSLPVRILSPRILDGAGRVTTSAGPGEVLVFEFSAEFAVEMAHPSFGLSLIRLHDHLPVFETSSTRLGGSSGPVRRGERRTVQYRFTLNVPPGEYAIGLHVRDRDALQYAVEEPYAVRLLVEGDASCGGIVHLDPAFSVMRTGTSADELVAR